MAHCQSQEKAIEAARKRIEEREKKEQLEKENTINVLERTTACGSSFVMCQHNLIIKI